MTAQPTQSTFAPAHASNPRTLVRVGDVLDEKYEVTKVLGQGGMGVVVAACHRELDKLVALKFMHEEVAQNEQAIDRFLREARAAARLHDEHVGRVLDVGRMAGGIPYIVMEYLDGRDLAAVAAERGAIDVPDVCEYMLQVCEAMTEAHAHGIVHRDLKPQNLFLTFRPDGRPLVKVLDFGISKAQFAQGPTATHATMGSPAYMSPEQIKSARSVDARADIWSLGVILFQLLSDRLPFVGDTITETMFKVVTDPVPSLAEIRPELPPALVAAVERCLAKDRDARFASVAELAHELSPFAPQRAAMLLIERLMSAPAARQPSGPALDLPPVMPAVGQTTLGTAASESVDRESPSFGRRWIAAIAVGMIAFGIFALTRGSGGDRIPTTTGAELTVRAPTPDAPIQPDSSVYPDAQVEFDAAVSTDASVVERPRPVRPNRPQPAKRFTAPDVPVDAPPDPQPDPRVYQPVEERDLKPVGEK